MTYHTHRVFAVSFALVGGAIISKTGLSGIHPLIAAPVYVMAAEAGALFPDVDHHWNNVKDKTVLNRVINFLIHATGGVHRSWQTHSWDLLVVSLTAIVIALGRIPAESAGIANTVVYGFYLGWISHLFADMLNPKGVRLLCAFNKSSVRFVPRLPAFGTGTPWEDKCFRVIRVVNVITWLTYAMYFGMPYVMSIIEGASK